MAMHKVGRNDACPCGSGKKFKMCCADAKPRGVSRGLMALIAAIAAVAALGLIPSLTGRGIEKSLPAASRQVPRPSSLPAPASGKVWSEEHGHWHDAAPAATTAAPAPASTTPPRPAATPQPAGDAPAGAVWSEEHGHWHDPAKP